MIIYCELMRKDADSATYNYSCGSGKPGIITFPLKKYGAYTIQKEPEKKCAHMWINKLFARSINDFLNGVAKETLLYQCG